MLYKKVFVKQWIFECGHSLPLPIQILISFFSVGKLASLHVDHKAHLSVDLQAHKWTIIHHNISYRWGLIPFF